MRSEADLNESPAYVTRQSVTHRRLVPGALTIPVISGWTPSTRQPAPLGPIRSHRPEAKSVVRPTQRRPRA